MNDKKKVVSVTGTIESQMLQFADRYATVSVSAADKRPHTLMQQPVMSVCDRSGI